MVLKFKVFKKCLYLLIIALIVFSCDKEKDIKIGFLIDSFATARWQKDKLFFEDKIKSLGGEVIVKSADGNDLTQYNQAIELIEQGVDVLVVVATNSNTAAAIVREAHKSNVKVIAYARIIKNCDLDYYISFNVEKIGELQAEFVTKRIPQGKIVLLNGDIADINAVKEYNGIMNVLKPLVDSKKTDIIYSGFMDSWSPLDAEFTMNEIIKLKGKTFDAVLVANDGMASGVIKVLKENNLTGKVLVTGLDAEAIACKRIIEGEQSMTVYMSIKELATNSAILAMQLARNEKITSILTKVNNGRNDIPTLILDPKIVEKENIEFTVVQDGFLTMDEINQAK
jgi:D-xylose transport system substrate-binding protein